MNISSCLVCDIRHHQVRQPPKMHQKCRFRRGILHFWNSLEFLHEMNERHVNVPAATDVLWTVSVAGKRSDLAKCWRSAERVRHSSWKCRILSAPGTVWNCEYRSNPTGHCPLCWRMWRAVWRLQIVRPNRLQNEKERNGSSTLHSTVGPWATKYQRLQQTYRLVWGKGIYACTKTVIVESQISNRSASPCSKIKNLLLENPS